MMYSPIEKNLVNRLNVARKVKGETETKYN